MNLDKHEDCLKEIMRLQNKINDALDLIDSDVKLVQEHESKRRLLILDSITIFKLVKILGDEDDQDK